MNMPIRTRIKAVILFSVILLWLCLCGPPLGNKVGDQNPVQCYSLSSKSKLGNTDVARTEVSVNDIVVLSIIVIVCDYSFVLITSVTSRLSPVRLSILSNPIRPPEKSSLKILGWRRRRRSRVQNVSTFDHR